jgi:hypothetical protein
VLAWCDADGIVARERDDFDRSSCLSDSVRPDDRCRGDSLQCAGRAQAKMCSFLVHAFKGLAGVQRKPPEAAHRNNYLSLPATAVLPPLFTGVVAV